MEKLKIDKSKLEGGKVYSNYKELCADLNIPVKSGNSKIAQMKQLSKYCEYKQDGYKIQIVEVYPEGRELENKYKGNSNRAKESNLLVNAYPDIAKLIDNPNGLTIWTYSKEVKFTCIKCGKVSMKTPRNIVETKGRCAVCLMSKGAREVYSMIKHLNVKLEYTFDNLKGGKGYPLRFDFAILDDSDEPIGLIEYDGEYHDVSEIIILHDKLKNNYCIENNIPLLRIHHTEKNRMYIKMFNFIESLHMNADFLNKSLLNEMIKETQILTQLISDNEKTILFINNLKELGLIGGCNHEN